MKLLILLAVLNLLTLGCASPGINRLAKTLAKDPATVYVHVVTPYGTIKFIRTNPGTNQWLEMDQMGVITIKGVVK